MAVEFRVVARIEGTEALRKALSGMGSKVAMIGGYAMYREGNDIMNASLDVVPVRSGSLKGTGWTHKPVEQDGGSVVVLSYGGPDVDYAVVQHETPPSVFRHNEGQSWKYLERPAYEATRGMGERVASFMRARVEREMAK